MAHGQPKAAALAPQDAAVREGLEASVSEPAHDLPIAFSGQVALSETSISSA
jgi:hypothetical protein